MDITQNISIVKYSIGVPELSSSQSHGVLGRKIGSTRIGRQTRVFLPDLIEALAEWTRAG